MISKHTYVTLRKALSNVKEYASGTKRKQLQSTYDKMLNEVSEHIFKEPCSNKMVFRQKINGIENKDSKLEALAGLLKNDHLLLSKDYREHAGEIKDFLENHIVHFLKEFSYEQLR